MSRRSETPFKTPIGAPIAAILIASTVRLSVASPPFRTRIESGSLSSVRLVPPMPRWTQDGAGLSKIGGLPSAANSIAAGLQLERPALLPQAAEAAAIDSPYIYAAQRAVLRFFARFGAVGELRPAGPELTRRSIARLWDASAVVAEYEGTLAVGDASFPEHLIPPWEALHKAGKTLDIISDEPDPLRLISRIPEEIRAGAYVATDGGGRVYHLDKSGAPRTVFEADPLTWTQEFAIKAASARALQRMEESAFPIRDKRWRSHGYSVRFEPGTSEQSVRAAGAILQQELDREKLPMSVQVRTGFGPTDAPTIGVTVASRADAVRFIANARQLTPKDVVVIGGSRQGPLWRDRSAAGRLETIGALSGARVFAEIGDPRIENLLVLKPGGPAVARRILMAVASKPLLHGSGRFGFGQSLFRRARILAHLLDHYLYSVWNYFIAVNVSDWRIFKAAHGEAARGPQPVSLANPRSFFIYSRMVGMFGGQPIVGSRNGSNDYMRRDVVRLFDRHFRSKMLDPRIRETFVQYVDGVFLKNKQRNPSNFRKELRRAVIGAALLPPDRLLNHFSSLMESEPGDDAISFQRDRQPRVLADFHDAVIDTVNEENPTAPDRVVGVVLFGGFGNGSAGPSSDFDLQVLTNNGSDFHVAAFNRRLRQRWSQGSYGDAHPINSSDKGFLPAREVVWEIHKDPFQVLSPDERLERILSPPDGHFEDRSRLNDPSLVERIEWQAFFLLLKLMTFVDDLKSFRWN